MGTPGQQGIAGARGPRVSVETLSFHYISGFLEVMGGKFFFAVPDPVTSNQLLPDIT